MTWLTIAEFTTQTGILASDSLVQTALNFTEKDIIRHIFLSKDYRTSNSTSVHEIGFYPMDIDGSGVIDTSDVDCFEFDSDNNYYSLNTSLTEVRTREQKVIFDIAVPTNSRNMHIEYKTGRERFDKMLIELKELELVKTANWFFNKVPMEKLQQGVSSWNINGVSVSFDGGAMKEIVEANEKQIKQLYQQLRINTSSNFRPGFNTKKTMFYHDRRVIWK